MEADWGLKSFEHLDEAWDFSGPPGHLLHCVLGVDPAGWYYDLHCREIAAGLCGAGAVAFVIGRVLNRRGRLRHEAAEKEGGEQEQEQQQEEGTDGS